MLYWINDTWFFQCSWVWAFIIVLFTLFYSLILVPWFKAGSDIHCMLYWFTAHCSLWNFNLETHFTNACIYLFYLTCDTDVHIYFSEKWVVEDPDAQATLPRVSTGGRQHTCMSLTAPAPTQNVNNINYSESAKDLCVYISSDLSMNFRVTDLSKAVFLVIFIVTCLTVHILSVWNSLSLGLRNL